MLGTSMKFLSSTAPVTSSLGSSPTHCEYDSAVQHTWNGIGSSLRPTFKRSDGEGALLSCAFVQHGRLKQEPGAPRNVLKSGRKGVAARSQVATGTEAPPVAESVESGDSVHKVVIVGAGVAGLSAAVALHKVGVKTLVLEQGSSIRTAGFSISLWGNAWRALEYLGVAEGLRDCHEPTSGIAILDRSGNVLKTFQYEECPGGPHEMRGVDRKRLIEALAAELPEGTIQLNSRVRAIRREAEEGLTKLELENGTTISTKVLVGCDGVNSVVGEWMGIPPVRYVGQVVYRGVGEYSDGHDFGTLFALYVGEGMRCGVIPLSPSRVYWFVCVNKASAGPKVTDRNLIKAQALEAVKEGWPEKLKDLVKRTAIESMLRSAITDRWNIPRISPPTVGKGVVLGGDALHPMTPNVAQGGGIAIEDGVILAHTLGAALSEDGGGDAESIQKALEDYAAERQQRSLPITVKSFLFGYVSGITLAPIVYLRNKYGIPNLVSPLSYLGHTLYDVGRLPSSKVTS